MVWIWYYRCNPEVAYIGVPGIALSGFNDDDKRSFILIPQWITQFISSDIIDEIDKNSYITIGFPDVPLEKIKGVKIADRRIAYDKPETIIFYEILGDNPHIPENRTIWSLKYTGNPYDHNINYDDTYLKEGYIFITPMSIDENNFKLLNIFSERKKQIPDFSLKYTIIQSNFIPVTGNII